MYTLGKNSDDNCSSCVHGYNVGHNMDEIFTGVQLS